jgi:uncharacterized protein (DUF362 family)
MLAERETQERKGPNMATSAVSVVKVEGDRVEDAVREAIEMAGDLNMVIPLGSSVLIKPNVVSPSPSGSGKITDARVTETVAKLVLERKPGRVVSVGYDLRGARTQCTAWR